MSFILHNPGGSGGSSSTSINVQDYGAEGDAKKVTDGACTNGLTTVTSVSGLFTAADVGKVIWGVKTSTKTLAVPLGTVATYVSATEITVSVAATSTETSLHLVWGTNDTTAIQAAHAAAKAMEPRGVVIVPAGGYIFDELLFDLTESTARKIGGVVGAGTGSTIFYPSPGHDLAATAMFAKTNGNCYDTLIQGFSVEGSYFQFSASGKHVIEMAGFINETLRDVRSEYLYGTTSGVSTSGYFTKLDRVYIESHGYDGLQVTGAGSVWVQDCIFANCGRYSVLLSGLTGTLNQKSFARIEGGWIDESNSGGLSVENCTDVVLSGVRINGPVGAAGLLLSSNSNVRAIGCDLLPWSTTGNRPGVDVASGSTLWLTGCRVDSSGTSHAITNAGTLYMASCRAGVSGSGTGLVNTGTVIDGGTNSVVSTSGAGTIRMLPLDRIGVVGNSSAPQLIAAGTTTGIRVYDDGTSSRRVDAYLNNVYCFVCTATNFTLNNIPISGLGRTNTAGGTTGARTINTQLGSVNFAAGATSLVVTNSLVTANSIVHVTMATNDATAANIRAVPAAGSFTIHLLTATTAEMKVNFSVWN